MNFFIIKEQQKTAHFKRNKKNIECYNYERKTIQPLLGEISNLLNVIISESDNESVSSSFHDQWLQNNPKKSSMQGNTFFSGYAQINELGLMSAPFM